MLEEEKEEDEAWMLMEFEVEEEVAVLLVKERRSGDANEEAAAEVAVAATLATRGVDGKADAATNESGTGFDPRIIDGVRPPLTCACC